MGDCLDNGIVLHKKVYFNNTVVQDPILMMT